MNPQATCGRIVHYYQMHQDPAGLKALALKPTAAIVTADTTEDGTAKLFVFQPGPFRQDVPYSELPKAGHWSWMPYQREKALSDRGNVSESAEPSA